MSSKCPRELWLAIFTHYLEAGGDRDVLRQVSRQWRALVDGAPEFWENVTLCKPAHFEDAQKFADCLRRSHERPMDIELKASHTGPKEALAVAKTLRTHTERLRTLYVEHTDPLVLSKMVRRIGWNRKYLRARPTPRLQALGISCKSEAPTVSSVDEAGRTFVHNPSVFISSLSLRKLSIPLDFELAPGASFWSRLTSLEIAEDYIRGNVNNDLSLEFVLDLLRLSPALEEFTFRCKRLPWLNLPQCPKDVQLERLQCMDIAIPHIGLSLLERIDAPHLVSLTLRGHRGDSSSPLWPPSSLQALESIVDDMCRSPLSAALKFPELRDLQLVDIKELRAPPLFFCGLTTVRSLQLERCDFSGYLEEDDIGLGCPEEAGLETLEFRACHSFILANLQKLYRAFRERGARLPRPTIESCPQVTQLEADLLWDSFENPELSTVALPTLLPSNSGGGQSLLGPAFEYVSPKDSRKRQRWSGDSSDEGD